MIMVIRCVVTRGCGGLKPLPLLPQRTRLGTCYEPSCTFVYASTPVRIDDHFLFSHCTKILYKNQKFTSLASWVHPKKSRERETQIMGII